MKMSKKGFLTSGELMEAVRALDWVNTLNRYSQVLRTLHRVRDVIR